MHLSDGRLKRRESNASGQLDRTNLPEHFPPGTSDINFLLTHNLLPTRTHTHPRHRYRSDAVTRPHNRHPSLLRIDLSFRLHPRRGFASALRRYCIHPQPASRRTESDTARVPSRRPPQFPDEARSILTLQLTGLAHQECCNSKIIVVAF